MRLLLTISILLLFISCKDDKDVQQDYQQEIEKQRRNKDKLFQSEGSPLKEDDLENFKGLVYYPIHEVFKITARLVPTPWDEPFTMPSTGKRSDRYVRYGIAKFEIAGQQIQLNVYQNLDAAPQEKYLFIPFKDATSGDDTYGGGRYLDIKYKDTPPQDSILLDFNLAYNPYCVYNSNFSCPIPPKENWLSVKIEAGEKDFPPGK